MVEISYIESNNNVWVDYDGTRIPCTDLPHALQVMQAIEPNSNIIPWRLTVSEQVFNAWNYLGGNDFGPVEDVIPRLLDSWRSQRNY